MRSCEIIDYAYKIDSGVLKKSEKEWKNFILIEKICENFKTALTKYSKISSFFIIRTGILQVPVLIKVSYQNRPFSDSKEKGLF